MSKLISTRLPAVLIEGLAGVSPARDQATSLVTVDGDRFPRISLLSRSEIHVRNETTMLLALWAGSTTTSNLMQRPEATIFRVDEGVPRSVRMRCGEPTLFRTSDGLELAVFPSEVLEVHEDQVPYASIVGDLEFEVHEPGGVLPRWNEVERHLRGNDGPAAQDALPRR